MYSVVLFPLISPFTYISNVIFYHNSTKNKNSGNLKQISKKKHSIFIILLPSFVSFLFFFICTNLNHTIYKTNLGRFSPLGDMNRPFCRCFELFVPCVTVNKPSIFYLNYWPKILSSSKFTNEQTYSLQVVPSNVPKFLRFDQQFI